MNTQDLPIWTIVPEFLRAMQQKLNVVLMAPPGSGKTTQIPWLLHERHCYAGTIVVVQPRRLACTTVAARVAEEHKLAIGDEVGYIVRYDGQVSLKTKLLFVTDGVLLRFLERDPNLSWASVVIFDEFHERRASVDVALGLLKRAQTQRRDLRLIIMSATIQGERVTEYLRAVSLETHGRNYPVDVRYDEDVADERDVPEAVNRWVRKLHRNNQPGDILVFLPGKEEIQRTARLLLGTGASGLSIVELHGELPREEQRRAFLSVEGRKVILSTNVAETSVTVPGVRIVIDGGFERRSEFDAGLQINHLNLTRISLASAEQRAGRAGREAPGICVRLWPPSLNKQLAKHPPTEIQEMDLASVVLTLKSLGIKHPQTFDYLDRPEPARLQAGEELLEKIGALDAQGELTPTGWQMLRLPLPPRYARMVVEGEHNSCLQEMATIAALMTGRPIWLPRRDPRAPDPRLAFKPDHASDFFSLLNMEQASRQREDDEYLEAWCLEHGVNADALREAKRLRRKVIDVAKARGSFVNKRPAHRDELCRCVLTGLVDMVAQHVQGRTYALANGMVCDQARSSHVKNGGLMVVAVARKLAGPKPRKQDRVDGTVDLLTAIKPEWLERMAPHLIYSVDVPMEHDHKSGVLTVRQERRVQQLVISFDTIQVTGEQVAQVLSDQEVRAQHQGWHRVEVMPGMNHRSHVIWRGKKVAVNSEATGPHWAEVKEDTLPITIELRERTISPPTADIKYKQPTAASSESVRGISSILSKILSK